MAVRSALDELAAEDSFSTWQRMWIADAAGDVRRGRRKHAHYDWLVACIETAPAALAATAAAAAGQLRLGDVAITAGALDRVGPTWRTQVLYGLAMLDDDAALANSEDLIDRLLVGADSQ